MGQDIFYRSDKNQIPVSLNERANDRRSAHQRHFGIAGKRRSGCRRPSPYVNELKIEGRIS
jgi:hypothetical protein